MSVEGRIRLQVDAAVEAAVAPLINGLAELTKRVSELETPAETVAVRAAPVKKAVAARAGTAGAKAEAKDTK